MTKFNDISIRRICWAASIAVLLGAAACSSPPPPKQIASAQAMEIPEWLQMTSSLLPSNVDAGN